MNYVVVLNHNDQPTDLNGVTAGKYGVLVSNGKTYLHPAVSDTTAAAAVAAPADTGKDVSKAGSTVQIAGGDAIAVPARSALLLGPTAAMSEPDDNPTNPNYPDNPDNSDHSDQLDKPSGNNAHDGANNAANGANNSSAPNGGTASTGSSIAVIIAMVIVLLIAGSGMLLRIHSPHE
ncbi:amylopullulanase [Bifidobacterium animalis]|uniref:amylopullulanase n=1 Tax=Bifidobacterium animalis TaxID=28025 RepID=UPI001BCF186D|nr:amylopullulanase [Bifidobacterium animalis]